MRIAASILALSLASAALGLEAVSSTPARFTEIIRTDADKLSKLIKETGAKAD